MLPKKEEASHTTSEAFNQAKNDVLADDLLKNSIRTSTALFISFLYFRLNKILIFEYFPSFR